MTMPRGKVKKSKSPKKIDRPKVRFERLVSRKMTQYEADLTRGSKSVGPARDDDEFRDAVVKPVVRYREGDEEQANKMAERMTEQARERGAVHVYRPERVVVGVGKVRAPDLKSETPPMEAAEMWMKERLPPSGVNPKEVLDYIEACLGGVQCEAFWRAEPNPFTVRQVGGENYGPFRGRWNVDVPGTGVFGVTGRYAGEVGRSNRSGKSAFVGSVRYAAYGESEYGRDQDKLVHNGEDKMQVEVDLACGPAGVKCSFGRRLKRGGSTKAVLNGDKCKQAEFDEARDEAIALSHADFVRTCFVREGDLHGLLGQGSAQIKADMMRWLGLKGWSHIAKMVGDDLSEARGNADKLRVEREVHQAVIDGTDVSVVQVEIDDLTEQAGKLEAAEKSGEEQRLAVRDMERRIEVAGKVRDALDVITNEKSCRARLQISAVARDEAETAANEVREKLGALRSGIFECERNMAGFDGKCPVDGERCPRVDEINANDEAMVGKLADLKAAQAKRQKALTVLLDERNENAGVADEMARELREIEKAKDFLDQQEGEPEAADKLWAELDALRSEASPNPGGLRDLRSKLDDLRADLKAVERAERKVEEIDREVAAIDRDLRMLRYSQLLAGKRGVPAMQIEGAARVVEGMANEVLAAMGQDHRLQFVFERELKSKKEAECAGCGRPWESGERKCPECSRERGMAVEDVFLPMVREGSATQSFDQDSAGGKSMLALAVRVALARFLGVAVLFLDEADGRLDEYNLEKFVGMLPRLLEQGFKQVFVISHRAYVRDRLEKCVEAVRHDGWSSVGWA